MGIIGFDSFTDELSENEMKIAEMVSAKVKEYGSEEPICNDSLLSYLDHCHNISINSARLRKVISYIRIKGLVKNLVANKYGYYVSSNMEEIENYTKSLDQRIAAIQAVRNSFSIQI